MRVVLCSWYSLQVSCRYKLAHQDAGSALYSLSAVVDEGEGVGIQLDAVTIDAADGTRSDDVVIEALFFQGIILRQTGLVNEIHCLAHRILDILVIRCESEEELVEHFHMALCLYVKRLFHRAPIYKNRHSTVKDIDFLMSIIDHHPCSPDAGDTDDDASQ